MNISNLFEEALGSSVTIVTLSGNKIKGTVLKNGDDTGSIKIKTDDGILLVNVDAIESIY